MSSQPNSTGPRTEEGKARSSQNARKHGLTAQQLFIPPEQREEFDEFHARLQNEVRPEGALQETLFDELVSSAWNVRRIRGLEAELLAQGDFEDKLDRLARHKTRIERTFHRSLRELKALQTNAALALTLPRFFTQFAPPLASAAQIAKRTHMIASPDEVNPVQDEHDALRAASRLHRKAAAASESPSPAP